MLENKPRQKPRDDPAEEAAATGLNPLPTPRMEGVERRNVARLPVIKSGKIIVGSEMSQGLFNCLILDQSPTGVLVDLGMLVNLPEEVRLQVGNGAIYLARRRWAVGTKAGLEFLGGQILSEETSLQMLKIASKLKRQGVCAAVGALRGAQFFEHEALRCAAEEAEAAYLRLEALLTNRP